MFMLSNSNTSHPLPIYSLRSSSLSSSSMKTKNLIHTLIVSRMCRIIRALSKFKSTLIKHLKNNKSNSHLPYPSNKKYCNKTNNIIMGSFRLHYNWSSRIFSSNVIPVSSRVYEGLPKGVISSSDDCCHDSELAGYLQWLEGNNDDDDDIVGVDYKGSEKVEEIIKDVDMLAEMFISNCHEKFRVEKEESYRRYEEMLAKSL